MSGFTQHIDSPFPDENILFNSASGITGQQIQQNQLGIQQKQLDLTAADHEQVGRLAAGLLNIQDPAARAQAYSRGVGMLQSQGLAKYAPPTLPDESSLRMLVAQTVPAQTQAEWLANIQANKAYGAATTPGPTASPAAPGAAPAASPLAIPPRGTGGPGASASAPTAWLPYFEEASQKTGIPVDLLIAQARQESGFQADAKGGAGEVGLFQIKPSTAASPGFGMQGVDPATLTGPDNVRNNIMFGAQYLRARMGSGDPNNPAVQAAGLHAYNGGGDPNYVANVFRYRPTLAASDPNAAVTSYTPGVGTATAAAAPPGAPAGAGGTPPPYTVASTAPVAPPGPAATPPGSQPVMVPTSPPNQMAPGGTNGPPAPTTAPAPAPSAAQPGQPGVRQPPQPPQPPPAAPLPPPPQMPVLNARGLTPQQQAQIDALASTGRMTVQQRMAAEQAFVTQNVQLRQQAFSDYMQQQQLQVQQGTLDNARYEANLKAWQAANPVPTTPRFTSGSAAVWNPKTSGWEQPTPDNASLGPPVAGSWGVNNTGQMQFLPASTVPAQGSYEAQQTLMKEDNAKLEAFDAQNQTASANQIRIQQMRKLIDQVSTGAGGAERADWANIADTLGWHDLAKQLVGMGGAAAAQEFAKYGLATAGAQERGDLGARGSLGAINLYKAANPGLELQPDANKKMLTAQLVAAQANRDYTQQAMDFVNKNTTQFLQPGGKYTPLSQFNAQWAAQRNPQIYAAAMGAINGDPWQKWTEGLNMKSPDDVQRVIEIVRHADPTSTVMWNNGQPHAVGTGQ